MSDATASFNDAFQAFCTGHAPFRWQCRLFEKMAHGLVPRSCSLPTGLGKTSIIPIWLIALAHTARANDNRSRLPRRLVYIVNRRTVVDQATDDAKRLLSLIYQSGRRDVRAWATDRAIEALGLAGEPAFKDEHALQVAAVRDALAALSGDDGAAPLAISTLRGELADDGEWKKNPARPAIIIGTIDMIGSKLLFSGYGDGRYGRAHHAGLVGQDALVVHDEAHLSPAFDALLRSVAAEQARCGESRPMRIMSLSATTRSGSDGRTDAGSPFGIEDADWLDHVVSQRLSACKSLTIVDAEKSQGVATIAEEAQRLGTSPARVLVYVRSPEAAARVAEAIEKGLGDGGVSRIARLTGTIRGKERDELAESEVFRAFKAGADRSSPLPHTLYLISTSAGEVGADLDADHLVCDLTTLDSMAQRFGRVNRLGGKDHTGRQRAAEIVVVMEGANATRKKSAGEDDGDGAAAETEQEAAARKTRSGTEYDAAVLKTGDILRRVAAGGGDVSPAGLRALIDGLSDEEKRTAFSPAPTVLPATDILFDHWALTSIGLIKGSDNRWHDALPGRPAVEPYLHGVAEWEPPETHVAWRADIALLAAAGGKNDKGASLPCSKDELEQVLDAFPLRSAEQLRERTDRVQSELRKLAERLRKEASERATREFGGGQAESAGGDEASIPKGAFTEVQERNRPIEPNPWVVLIRRGEPVWERLETLAPADNDQAKTALRDLAFATVVLPVEAGGLKGGMLDGSEPAPEDAKSFDVAEMTGIGQRGRQRVLVRADENERALLGGKIDDGMPTKQRLALHSGRDDDEEPTGSAIVAIEFRVAKGEAGEPGGRVRLDEHNAAVGEAARRMADALRLGDELKRVVALAGRLHDLGKGRDWWQQYANNPRPSSPAEPYDLIAKNRRYRDARSLRGYRHEFGSLHDAEADHEIQSLDSDSRDLVLHLIAAHHGWARPHFEPRHYDPGGPGKPRPTADNERLAIEVMQRYGRLQQRYGRWGLAWLESILRCADAEASHGAAGVSPMTVAADNGGGVA